MTYDMINYSSRLECDSHTEHNDVNKSGVFAEWIGHRYGVFASVLALRYWDVNLSLLLAALLLNLQEFITTLTLDNFQIIFFELVKRALKRHWSLYSTYWRYTNKIIIINIIIIIIIINYCNKHDEHWRGCRVNHARGKNRCAILCKNKLWYRRMTIFQKTHFDFKYENYHMKVKSIKMRGGEQRKESGRCFAQPRKSSAGAHVYTGILCEKKFSKPAENLPSLFHPSAT